MTIDFHTHVFPPEVLLSRELFLDDPGFTILYSEKKSKISDHRNLMEYLLKSGIDGAAAMSFPWRDEKNAMNHNLYMASVPAGSNIYPFGMIPLKQQKKILHYAEEIRQLGLYGIGEIAFYDSGMNDENCRFLREVLEAGAELSLPVCIHLNEPVGHVYPGKYDPAFAAVYEIIKGVPDAAIILSHWGGGLLFYELMPEVRDAFKNVCYDTAATPFLYSDSIYESALSIIDADKILFGSDYPLLGADRYIGAIEKGVQSVELRGKILSGNAERILGISRK